jgi:hypothetical protein
MSKLTDLTQAYLSSKEALEEAKKVAETTKDLLMHELEQSGLKSIKTDVATVSIVKKPVYTVNEREVTEYLKEQPDLDIDEFFVTSMDKRKVTMYAEHQLKTTGEVIPGIEASETEYLMVRQVKEKE